MQKLIFISMTVFLVCSAAYALPGKDGSVNGKIYFSNQPFTTSNAGSKNNFTSADYIYGRIELDAQTINEAFRVFEPNENYPHAYFLYRVYIFHNGKEMGFNSSWNICLLKPEHKNNKWFNFDVLPEPAKATTVLCGTDRFTSALFSVPLYHLFTNSNFPENGEYRLVVKFYSETYDVWGKMEAVEKWPKLEEEFTFTFNEKDVPMLKKNEAAADAVIQENAFKMSKLPDVFTNPAKVNDVKLTVAKIAAILKRDMPHWAVLKFAIEPVSGPLWLIEKDDYGLIKQRYLSPYLHVAYKKDGNCYVGYLQLVEKYEAGGRYGPLQVGFTSSSMRKDNVIDCSKVK